jgi:hypothetical protein
MSELHKSSHNDATVFEGQHGLLCGTKTTPTQQRKALSDCSLKALIELSDVLKPIYIRMKKEGYGIIEGRLVKQNENE